jgi:hypothetical protein
MHVLKGRCNQMNTFWKALKIKSVRSVLCERVFTYVRSILLAVFFIEKTNIKFLLTSVKTLHNFKKIISVTLFGELIAAFRKPPLTLK